MKISAAVLTLILALTARGFAQSAAKNPSSSAASSSDASTTAPSTVDKGAQLKALISILESITDDDFNGAVAQAPAKAPQQAASRAVALSSAYSTLAANEYHAAAAITVDKSSGDYQQAYQRVQAPQDTGWAINLLEWLGNAAINYAVGGGQTYVGRSLDNTETGKLHHKLGRLDKDLAKADAAPQQAALHFQMGSVYEQLAAAAVAPPSADVKLLGQEQRLIKLSALLKSFSDDDYKKALAQLSAKKTPDSRLSTREDALKSVYLSLAALEYRQAGQPSSAIDAQAVMVDTGTLEQTGWAIDVFKWLGNAAINYALNGGQTYVGRKLKDSPADVLDKKIAGLYTELGSADTAEKKADIHSQIGAAYEELAALPAEAVPDEVLTAKREARLRQLADLLLSVSDDDYNQALKALPAKSAARRELASRSTILKSSYVTLAALEYRQASKQAPDKSDYSGDLKRISDDDAKNLVVNPETLQETGWATDLLSVATLGGVGYLIYENQVRHRGGRGGSPAPSPAPAPSPSPAPAPAPNPPPGFTSCTTPNCVSTPPIVTDPDPNLGVVCSPSPCPGSKPQPPVQVPPVDQLPPVQLVPQPAPIGGGIIACGPSGDCGRMPTSPELTECFGPGKMCEVGRQLNSSATHLQDQLASADIGPDQSAGLHHQLGSVYEQLAAASGKTTTKTKAAPKVATKPVPVAPAPAPEAHAPATEQPQPEAQPTKDELIRQDMKQMDDLEKEMKQKIQQAPPQQNP